MTDVDGRTAEATPGAATPDEDDRMDAAGWWQLAALAVLGAVAPFALLAPAPHGWTAAVVLAIVLVVLLPVVQLRAWWSRGGRGAVRRTRAWIRAGRVPGDVPAAVWRPRVQRAAADGLRHRIGAWVAVALAVTWAVLAVTGRPVEWLYAGVWALTAVVAFLEGRGARAATRLLAATA